MTIEFEPHIVATLIHVEWSDNPKMVLLDEEMPDELRQLWDDWLHEIEIERAWVTDIQEKHGVSWSD